jgi:hypothetical protein
MAWSIGSRAAALFSLGAVVLGCSTIDGGNHGDGSWSGGGTSAPPPWDGGGADDTAGEPDGPEYGQSCLPGPEGTDYFHGWRITCNALSSSRGFVNPADSVYVEVQDLSGPFESICCGGSSPVEEADADCQALCMELVCEAARVQHVAWAVEASSVGMGGDCLDFTDACGFDFEACLTGMPHEQVGQPGNLFSYLMIAECEAVHDQQVSPWGTHGPHWDWIELPNEPTNDSAPVCAPLPVPPPGPPERSPEMELEGEPGTTITLHWALAAGPSGTEQSLDAEVGLAYSVGPCAEGECFSLSRLDVTLPDGIHHGFSLANLHVILEEATPAVPISTSGHFAFGPRTIHMTTSFTANGVPIVITGHNAGTAQGVALPTAGVMSLTDLAFAFDDGLIAATLELDVLAAYVQHGPEASIEVVDAPADCAAPVMLEAVTVDLDDDPLTHVWWVPPWFLGTGEVWTALLPPGQHGIYLTSIDSSGRADSTAMRYVRACR